MSWSELDALAGLNTHTGRKRRSGFSSLSGVDLLCGPAGAIFVFFTSSPSRPSVFSLGGGVGDLDVPSPSTVVLPGAAFC